MIDVKKECPCFVFGVTHYYDSHDNINKTLSIGYIDDDGKLLEIGNQQKMLLPAYHISIEQAKEFAGFILEHSKVKG